MSLTRQHFTAISSAISNSRPINQPEWQNALDCAAKELARKLAQFNPNFDRAKFLVACGVRE